MIISFVEKSWDDYNEWANIDKKIFKKIQKLLKETIREPFGGIGKPEPLKNNLRGYWSKRITDEHRLVYKVEANQLIVISCRFSLRLKHTNLLFLLFILFLLHLRT